MVSPSEESIAAIQPASVGRVGASVLGEVGAAGVPAGPQEEPEPAHVSVQPQKVQVLDDLIQLVFEHDDNTGRMVARVKNSTTGEVLRQIPPEEMLKLARLIDKYLGLFVDRQS
jgi:flagellar protein FlaG